MPQKSPKVTGKPPNWHLCLYMLTCCLINVVVAKRGEREKKQTLSFATHEKIKHSLLTIVCERGRRLSVLSRDEKIELSLNGTKVGIVFVFSYRENKCSQ